MMTLGGRLLREGNAAGILYVPDALPSAKDEHSDPVRETRRFENAREQVSHFHRELAEKCARAEKLGKSAAALFSAYNVILSDEELVTDCLAAIIAEEETAESAVRAVFDRAVARFLRLPDPYMRERSLDIEDVKESLLFALAGRRRIREIPDERVILAAPCVLPSMAAALGEEHIAGIATGTAFGGHVLAFAEMLGVPLLCGADGILAGMSGKSALISSNGTLAIEQ